MPYIQTEIVIFIGFPVINKLKLKTYFFGYEQTKTIFKKEIK